MAARYELRGDAADRILALLAALAAESDPHTTVVEPVAALDRHVADSLAGLEAPGLASASRIGDIGAGAGFPGLVLALALPNVRVDLIEAARRKTAVISRLAAAAALPNVRAVTARAEEWALEEGANAYDAVTVRAVAGLPVLLEYAAPLLRLDGKLVAWKGRRDPAEERAAVTAAGVLGMGLEEVIPVRPFKGSQQRHLYVYSKASPTPDRFPRRPGMAAKRPIAKP